MLSAFLPLATVTKIFGNNLFDDPALLTTFRELLGVEGIKPFECVGTPEETCAAFFLASKKRGAAKLPAIAMFIEQVLPTIADPQALVDDALRLSPEHAIPPDFSTVIPAREAPVLG